MLLKFGTVSVIGAETGGSRGVERVPTEGECKGGGAEKKEGEGEEEVITVAVPLMRGIIKSSNAARICNLF